MVQEDSTGSVMQLRQLEIFRAVMMHGTVTAAARSLQISQPAATAGIRALERRLELPLFRRSRGRLQPTPEAAGLYEEVDRIFRTVAVVEKYAHDLKEAHSGVLTIAATPSLACSLLAETIGRFRAAHPRVRVWMQATTTREVIDLAQKRQIDFGVIYPPAAESGLSVEPLFAAELVCVMAPGHPLAHHRTLDPDALRGHALIANVRNDPILALIEQAFGPHDLRRQVMVGTNHTAAACALAAAGAGVAIVEPMSVGRLFPGLVQLPFRPSIPVRARIVYSAAQPLARLASRFVRELRSNAIP